MTPLEKVRQRAEIDAKTSGCYLNPDAKFLNDLLEGLKRNEERYGYPSCPCRLGSGRFEFDRDIICPCDYRDPDVTEHGACYCGLYVKKDVFEGKTPLQPVPERRPAEKQSRAYGISMESPIEKTHEKLATKPQEPESIKMRIYYCRQCGYVCFREDPPYICPICKANREMFAELTIRTIPLVP